MSEAAQTSLTESRTPDGFLTFERVRSIYADCFRAETVKAGTIQIEAWLLRHTFSNRAIVKHREDIVRMLLCVPRGFRVDERNGGSVFDISRRDDGSMWTGDMADVEKFLALGIALNLVEFCAPREKWQRLPGGLPYVRILITRFGVSVH